LVAGQSHDFTRQYHFDVTWRAKLGNKYSKSIWCKGFSRHRNHCIQKMRFRVESNPAKSAIPICDRSVSPESLFEFGIRYVVSF